MEKGVLVATDQYMEWLLPWWWENYSYTNVLPVAFVDLGMSEEKRNWCQSRGEVLTVEIQEREEKEVASMEEWEKSYGSTYRQARRAWFQKPKACLLSPFQETIWLDLDCEVLRDISPLFSLLPEHKEIGAVLERIEEGRCLYNGGVIVFRRGSSILDQWAALAATQADQYWGDDRILSHVIAQHVDLFTVLPEHYNWRLSSGIPLFATIIHWNGEWGKACIAKEGGYRRIVEGLLH